MSLPTYFSPHGTAPCFFMEWTRGGAHTWDSTAAFLRGLVAGLPERPSAILVVSGHWEAQAFTVGGAAQPELIFDYYGFPEHTYQLTFGAPGAPQLAGRVQALLEGAGLPATRDDERGWDHGVFVPLKLVTPEADIPVVQLSLQAGLDPALHLAAGKALAPLRDEGVLIVGSGMSWHNMRGFSPAFTAKSEAFADWLAQAVRDPQTREAALARWPHAPFAREAHPREEHFAPLFVAAGAAFDKEGREAFRAIAMDVAISAFEFGERQAS